MSRADINSTGNFDGISVVICCYNSAQRISKTLECLSKQTNVSFPWEIILVNNNSSDNTDQIAENFWKEKSGSVKLRMIHEPNPGKANALATGFNNAIFDLILICDDDNWLQPYYLSRVMEIFEKNPDIGMLGGYGSDAVFDKDEKIDRHWFDEIQNYYVVGNHIGDSGFLEKGKYQIWGAGSVFPKAMWQFLIQNGFSFKNSRTAGRAQAEDAELSYIISVTGHNLYFDDQLTFEHYLGGGRVSPKNLKEQILLNAVNSTWIFHYRVLVKQAEAGINRKYISFYMEELWIVLLLTFNLLIRHIFVLIFFKSRWRKKLFYGRKILLIFNLAHLWALIGKLLFFQKRAASDLLFIQSIYNSRPLDKIDFNSKQ